MAISELLKKCKVCGRKKPTDKFYRAAQNRDGLNKICKKCYCGKRFGPEYRARLKAKRQADRRAAIDHYGGCCACCGERRFEFLSIDHVDGGGSKHRREVGTNIGLWLKVNGYPKGFRVLCHNCNQAIGFYGYCPHGNERREQMT